MRSLRPVSVCLLLLLAASIAVADGPTSREWDVDGLEPLLPHAATAAERALLEAEALTGPARGDRDDPPPATPVRNCAEWEPCTGVLIRYPLGLPYGLLRDMDDDVKLYVVVSSGYQSTAYNNLNSNGVDMDQVEFVVRANDSIWTRDYGPWYVFDGNGDIAIVDHEYNRPRPNDDLIPIYVGQQLGIPVHTHSMYHTGGNYMTDGAHVSSSTRLVYNEAQTYNGMNESEVDALMFDYYGIETYHVLEYIESGGIHHIDTWAKFLDEETVLVKEPYESHWTWDDLEQRAALLASLPSSTGRNYQVHRVYCYNIGGSSPASYTNSLILNDCIYVPFFGNSTYDEQALEVYRQAAPGYNVRGYYYSGFLSDDALHCRTKGLMDADMLRVQHVPVIEDQPNAPVEVRAHIRAHGRDELTATTLHWRHGSGAWQTTALAPTGTEHEFAASIPAPAGTDTCHYYVTAADEGGRLEGMPRVAPNHWYRFLHSGDATAAPVPAAAVSLGHNYPNPFNPGTTFSFALHHADHAELAVIDARGRHVRTLVDRTCPAGTTEVYWDGTDDTGRTVPSGTYFYRLRAAGLQYTRSASLVK